MPPKADVTLEVVLALSAKAAKLKHDSQLARAAECYGRAATAAAQLTGGNDCLIVAALWRDQYVSLAEHTAVIGTAVDGDVAVESTCAEQLSEIIAVVERRRAAGTLLSVTAIEKE